MSLNFILENQLSRMFSGVALRYNNKYNRTGPLFKEGTKRVRLKKESRIVYQLCYVHHNPIHHNLVKDYNKWPYCSYQDYFKNNSSLVSTKKLVNWMGGMDVFKQHHTTFKLLKAENLFDEFLIFI